MPSAASHASSLSLSCWAGALPLADVSPEDEEEEEVVDTRRICLQGVDVFLLLDEEAGIDGFRGLRSRPSSARSKSLLCSITCFVIKFMVRRTCPPSLRRDT